MYEILTEAMNGKCSLIDNRNLFTRTAPNDGLHLINSESRDWGLRISGQIQRPRASAQPAQNQLRPRARAVRAAPSEPQPLRLRNTQEAGVD
jgi:hypothetical protein